MTKYTLHTFPKRGFAEFIRLIFKYKNIEYCEKYYEFPKTKDYSFEIHNSEFNKLPVLQIDDITITLPRTIGRYLGREFNLRGENDLDDAYLDAIVDQMCDIVTRAKPYICKKLRVQCPIKLHIEEGKSLEVLQRELEEDIFPTYLQPLEETIAKRKGPYILGEKLVWADFFLACCLSLLGSFGFEDTVKKYKKLAGLIEVIESLDGVKEYIRIRPTDKL
ncbi:hypothetical protein SNEBB_000059 [Seison nebaliae]|nr:hypothetical protein SNEBB_000059 [Seison nebaliae]